MNNSSDSVDAVMTVAEAKRALGVGERWIYSLIHAGRLRIVTPGGGRGHHTTVSAVDVQRERQRRADLLERRLRGMRG